MKLFSIEEFAAKRRADQDRYAEQVTPPVTKGIASGDFDQALSVATRIFIEAYKGDTDKALDKGALNSFISTMDEALKHTTTESDVLATSLMIATAALNSSAAAAAQADDEDLVLEWVDMEDEKVRKTHHAAHGQQRAPGELFSVGLVEMPYPGYPGVDISEWINCRCVARPAKANDQVATLRATLLEPEVADLRASLVADASTDDGPHTSLVVVALPAADDPVHGFGDEQKHLTLAFLGDDLTDPQAVHNAVGNIADLMEPFSAVVSGNGSLGPDGAKVLFVEAQEIQTLRDGLGADETISAAVAANDTHPHFIPHMTVDYADDAATPDLRKIAFDRLAVWQGEEQTEYPLGVENPTGVQPAEPIAAAVEDEPVEAPKSPKNPLPVRELPPIEQWGHDDTQGIPIHGVLAPEGVESGDKRGFREGALSHRPLPLPLTWQEKTAEGHDDAAVVAVIEKIEMIDGLQHFSGHMRQTDEADKALGLMIDFGGRYGLSVDADAVAGEYDEASGVDWYSEARSCGSAMVNIPAFPEAFVAVGPHLILDAEPDPAISDDAPALVAAGAFLEAVQKFKDLAPGVTEDGPGWLTHPVDTDRLRDYWVRGEGAAKIGWGVPGDFNRCRVNLAPYVKPQYINGYCANRHYDALHVWPGQEAASKSLAASAVGEMAPAFTLVASGGWCAPGGWFQKPSLEENPKGTGVVMTEEGRTFGRIAEWGECHIGLPGVCTAPPESESEYAYFMTGEVMTTEGYVPVGQLTIGDGHADGRLGYRGASAHYDNVCAAWADVTVGRDEIGIWFAGAIRPNATPEMLHAARASGRLSGDWRDVHGNLELTAALSVNSGGFPIPKFFVDGDRQVSLVASGVVAAAEQITAEAATDRETLESLDPKTFDMEVLITMLVERLDRRDEVKQLQSALSEGI